MEDRSSLFNIPWSQIHHLWKIFWPQDFVIFEFDDGYLHCIHRCCLPPAIWPTFVDGYASDNFYGNAVPEKWSTPLKVMQQSKTTQQRAVDGEKIRESSQAYSLLSSPFIIATISSVLYYRCKMSWKKNYQWTHKWTSGRFPSLYWFFQRVFYTVHACILQGSRPVL